FGAATRASSLTRQLLAVGRRAVLAPVVFDIDATIARMDALIRQTVGESIALRLDVSADGRRVKADPHEFERVLLNLVLNARDARPAGGALTIATGGRVLAEDALEHGGAPAGRYVWMKVCDTGVGMSPETRTRVFEPFFTTKPAGQGSGLGLAAV